MGQKAHGIPAMVALGGVDNPVLVAHHFVKTLEQPHAEGGAECHDNQEQYRLGYFHRHCSILLVNYFPFARVTIIRQIKAEEEPRGGVSALRRTRRLRSTTPNWRKSGGRSFLVGGPEHRRRIGRKKAVEPHG